MKRLACILCVLFPLASLAAQELPKPPATSKPLVVEPVKKTAGPAKSGLLRRGLTVRQSWAMGITPRNVLKAYRSLESDGTITDESSEIEVASAVGGALKANNKPAFEEFQGPLDSGDSPAADAALDPKWLAILEAIINILKLLGIL